MEIVLKVLQMLIPILVMLGIGIACRKFNFLSPDAVSGIKTLITSCLLPVLVFNTMANTEYGLDSVALLGISAGFHIIFFAVALKIAPLFGEYQKLYPYMAECFECGMIGYALIGALVGTENLGPVATLDLPASLFGFGVVVNGMAMMAGGKQEHGTVYSLLHTPTFVAVVVGAICGLAGIGALILGSPIGPVYEKTVDTMTAPITPLILVAIGYDLQIEKSMLKDVLKVFLSRFAVVLVFLALALLICQKMGALDRTLALTLIMYFALPPTFLSPAYAKGKQARFASCFLSVYIIFTLLVFTVLCAFRG